MPRNFLSPEEKARVIMFNNDPVLKDAVKKVMLYYIYNAETLEEGKPVGLDENWVYGLTAKTDFTDEQAGRWVRTKIEALSFLEKAFQDIGKYKAEVEQKEEDNIAL